MRGGGGRHERGKKEWMMREVEIVGESSAVGILMV